jgi:aspartokinase/homoserine dehydrogenase 1
MSMVYTANPKIVKQAYCIYILSGSDGVISFGAKVLFPPTIQPVLRKNIPIHIKNTFEPEAEGTYKTLLFQRPARKRN